MTRDTTPSSAFSVTARWRGDHRHYRLSPNGEPCGRFHALVTRDRGAAQRWAEKVGTDPEILSVRVIDANTGRIV
ncbi:MAG TPA: hypothetical protein PKD63_00165 [Solirubrobacteraceae bacterium]|nr:hypothetical protein [Solirubrobacteraceae bacterium]